MTVTWDDTDERSRKWRSGAYRLRVDAAGTAESVLVSPLQ